MKIDANYLRRLSPLDRLSPVAVEMLLKYAKVERFDLGKQIFSIGDRSPYTYYLLKGELKLTSGDGNASLLRGGSEKANYPFGSLVPRQISVEVASPKALVLQLDRELLEKELTWGILPESTAVSLGDAPDSAEADRTWITSLLHTPVFFRLPIVAVQELLEKFKKQSVKAGDVIIREGDPGDFYYVIRSGECRVTKGAREHQVLLNRLRAPECFGDEALITDQPRVANVIMETDGVLMRLPKYSFRNLIKNPAVNRIGMKDVLALLAEGRARLIDVRTEAEFVHCHLHEASNIPLYMMYLKSRVLSKSKSYIVYCDSGTRSEAAAFLLTKMGLNAYLLENASEAIAEACD